jgi:hypothetical protein
MFNRDGLLKPVLAGLLALLFLVGATFAANPSLHEKLHHHDASHSEFCFACAIAAGLMSSPEAATITVFVALGLLCCVISPRTVLLPFLDYLLLPGRAPPCF